MLEQNTSLASLCPNGFSSSPGHGGIAQQMQAQSDNVKMIYAAAKDAGVPPDLALAVSYHESAGFNSCAGSPTGVKGPMQLTQATGRAYGYNRDINEQNIKGGMAVLKAAYDKCGDSDYACLAKYYNGSTPDQQQQWANGVKSGHNTLKNNPSLVASACNTTAVCEMGPGDFNTGGDTKLASIAPPPAGNDINVAADQV